MRGRCTTVCYDHRCNGRSSGSIASFTWDNLTADPEALREHLGFDRWAVIGHSFGGHVALEYALRYPGWRVAVGPARYRRGRLLGAGARTGAAGQRGCPAAKAELVRRWFHGDFQRRQYLPIYLRISDIYDAHPSLALLGRQLRHGWRSRMRPRALIASGRYLLNGWSVLDRLEQIEAPTLVLAGRDDVLFPPDSQEQLAAAIPGARLVLIDDAGHNSQVEQPSEALRHVRSFLSAGEQTAA